MGSAQRFAKRVCALWTWDCWVSPEAHLLLGYREYRGHGRKKEGWGVVSSSFPCPKISVLWSKVWPSRDGRPAIREWNQMGMVPWRPRRDGNRSQACGGGGGVAHWVLTGLLPKSKRHASVSHWLFIKVPSAHFAKTLWTDCLKFELWVYCSINPLP